MYVACAKSVIAEQFGLICGKMVSVPVLCPCRSDINGKFLGILNWDTNTIHGNFVIFYEFSGTLRTERKIKNRVCLMKVMK